MRILNLPNMLTVARIIIIPMFVTAVIYQKHRSALALFVIAALTDLLDGFIARVTNQKTALGQFLDPLADKALLISSFILFSVQGWIPLWLTITVISRDLIVVIGWFLLYLLSHRSTIEPVMLGKTAIALQLITLALVLLSINLSSKIPQQELLFAVTALVTGISGIQYIYNGLRLADAI
ncbi:MAG: CDP-diacylglycerol--glycerol-3-phosphate 3-phosphatidyltransferase [Nitrospirae bacterium]|nr:CDP-diacylglycerol--glycerol-3-phosphate 3-phosphatidyltransferase [Nitrospirota bacterium]